LKSVVGRETLSTVGRAFLVVSVALTLALGVGAPSARADDAAESRFFDGLARAEYARRHYETALELFLRAHRAAPGQRSLYNIALCAQLAHEDAMAFAYFEELLEAPAQPGDETMRADATTRRTALAATLALVRVESDPPGAQIYVDQRDHGTFGTTPRTIALPAGAHHLELALAGHADASTDVTAVVGQAVDARASLTAYQGTVTITVAAPGATVIAHRGDVAIPVPASAPTRLDVGAYTFTASAPGFRDGSVEAHVARDATEQRAITLEPVPVPTGRLLVSSGEVHARVQIDGADRAETPARLADLTVGTHDVRVTADGFLAWTGTVDVAENRTAFVNVTLVRAR
jgi:hypothetical protein